MVESFLRQSPLHHLGLLARAVPGRGEAGVALAEIPFRGIVNLRGKSDAFHVSAAEALGFHLPGNPNTVAGGDNLRALWLGPDEWWVICKDAGSMAQKFRQALAGEHSAVTEVGENFTCIRVAGPAARELLAKGCPLDLHPRAFAIAHCAQSQLAKASIVLHQTSDEPAFDVYVRRSFAEYLWSWLEDAAQEYGLAVVQIR